MQSESGRRSSDSAVVVILLVLLLLVVAGGGSVFMFRARQARRLEMLAREQAEMAVRQAEVLAALSQQREQELAARQKDTAEAESVEAEPGLPAEARHITIDADGKLQLDGQPVEIETLSHLLESAEGAAGFVIHADPACAFGRVAAVLDACHATGVRVEIAGLSQNPIAP